MELKQLNKIILILSFIISTNVYSQMTMNYINGKKLIVNSEAEKRNLIKIYDNSNYTIYYILDRKDFDLKIGLGTNGIASIIFFSKKYDKGILVNLGQMTYRVKKDIYEINLNTGSHDKYMLIPSMIIVDKDFNYEYLMKYYYMMPPPPKEGDYSSWITIQNIKNYCDFKHIDIKGNAIYEEIDNILSNISKININENKSKKCNPIIYDMDLKDFFPKKIDKDGRVYYKK